MMTSSNGNIFRVTGHLCGEFTGPRWQRPVTRSFDVFFDLRPNKRLSKQWWGWWFETQSYPLWRHCNEVKYWLCPLLPAGLPRLPPHRTRLTSAAVPTSLHLLPLRGRLLVLFIATRAGLLRVPGQRRAAWRIGGAREGGGTGRQGQQWAWGGGSLRGHWGPAHLWEHHPRGLPATQTRREGLWWAHKEWTDLYERGRGQRQYDGV